LGYTERNLGMVIQWYYKCMKLPIGKNKKDLKDATQNLMGKDGAFGQIGETKWKTDAHHNRHTKWPGTALPSHHHHCNQGTELVLQR